MRNLNRAMKLGNTYIDEILSDLYSTPTHFIFELLQNADDSNAKHVYLSLEEDRLIFTHDGGQKLNGGDQEFKNHGYYVEGKYKKTITPGPEGKVMVFFDNSTANLADVYCYIYDGTKAAQEWPGLKMSLDNETEYNGKKGYYTVEVPAAFVTGYFVINNGQNGSVLTGETVYVNGQASSIENTVLQEVQKAEDNAWYTLTGMRIGKPAQPGLYIHNGKKVIIRK